MDALAEPVYDLEIELVTWMRELVFGNVLSNDNYGLFILCRKVQSRNTAFARQHRGIGTSCPPRFQNMTTGRVRSA